MDKLLGDKKKVAIVGGGVAGSGLAKSLQDHADVYLIDPNDATVEPSFAERTLINHAEYLSKAHVITSAATNITENEVTTADGRCVGFDYLVIATGHAGGPEFTKSEKIHKYEAGEMANSSSSSQSSQKIVRKPGNTNNPEGELRCDHNLPVEYFTSKTELNPFRRFYCCRFHHRWDDCGVWQWIDPELTSHYKAWFHNMLVQRNKARELVDLNGMKAQVESLMLEASTLKEELALQIEAFRDLQKANTAMEGVMTHLQWKNRIFLIFMVVLSLWVFF